MNDKDLLKLLKKNGWNVVRINGSHHVLQKKRENYSNPHTWKRCSYRLTQSNSQRGGTEIVPSP